jgi:hypothetical protein
LKYPGLKAELLIPRLPAALGSLATNSAPEGGPAAPLTSLDRPDRRAAGGNRLPVGVEGPVFAGEGRVLAASMEK